MSQPTKKLINTVDNCVDDNLKGFVKSHGGVRLLEKNRVVIRDNIAALREKGQVTILSGGGSGHEPFAAGYVGFGMLSAAVAGSIFTSPPSNNILAAIRLLATGNAGGTLLLVPNYTGDRLTFGQAMERARLEGLKVEMVVVAEDCALTSVNKSVGRRGLVGLIFILKIAGALAESGSSLDEIVDTVTKAVSSMGTIGICLNPCSLPGSSTLFQLGPDEMEIGLGIHGEAGVKRIKIRSADAVFETMMSHMTNPESASHLSLKAGDQLAVIVNNLGGLSQLEMNIMSSNVISYLTTELSVLIQRFYVGTFQTSLEMIGLSVSLLHVNEEILKCLDASSTAPAWLQTGKGVIPPESDLFAEPLKERAIGEITAISSSPTLKKAEADLFCKCIFHACDTIEMNEAKLNSLDSGCGDGDCGTTLKTGAKAVRALLDGGMSCVNPKEVLLKIADALSQSMGGCSGGLFSIFFTAASAALSTSLTPMDWCHAIECGTNAIMQYGGAEPGDRTMIDSLQAASSMLRAQLEVGSRPVAALTEAVGEAREACDQTAGMRAKAGRASYVSMDLLNQPDAGATAIVIILEAILEIITVE